MRRVIYILILFCLISFPVSASEIVAPAVPDNVESLFPENQDQVGESLLHIVQEAFRQAQPWVAQVTKLGAQVIGIAILMSLIGSFSGKSAKIAELVGVLTISTVLIADSNSLILSGTEMIWQLSQYGKLLFPVMATALITQGGTITATTLYGAVAFFDAAVCVLIASVLVPMLYIVLVFSIINAATGDDMLGKLAEFSKKAVIWLLKAILYIFVGYIGISGIISGAADQTAIKATKLTLSGMIPVVGGILSDASETLLVSVGVIKNTVGIYGMLSIICIVILPFLKIGFHYLALKISSVVAGMFVPKSISKLLEDFTAVLGLVLGMTGSVCMIQLISLVCFLKGMT